MDEPSNAELARQLSEIRRILVSRDEYAARLEAAERRFADLAGDVDRLDRKHDTDIARVHERIDSHEKGHAAWRQVAYPMAASAVMALAAILVQIWIGGH